MEEKRRTVCNAVGIALGGGLLSHWIKPICNSIVLPAHAQTSAEDAPASPPSPPRVDPPPRRLAANTPPAGENIVVDADFIVPVRYSMLPHISDPESLPVELSLSIVSLPEFGVIELFEQAEFEYLLRPESIDQNIDMDQFTYQVIDPQGARSAVYKVDLINLINLVG